MLTCAGGPAMLPPDKQGVKGPRKPVRVRHGPATVTGERTRRRHRPQGRGKAGEAKSRESGDWPFAHDPKPGRGPREGDIMEKILGRRQSPVLPLWSLLALALLLLALFVLLSASGDLLMPLLGRAAGPFDYLHEFAHDGRHLLGAPCH